MPFGLEPFCLFRSTTIVETLFGLRFYLREIIARSSPSAWQSLPRINDSPLAVGPFLSIFFKLRMNFLPVGLSVVV